ncbi:MAG: ABC transporter permease [Propionibacteriaceae bacterium]|jgi:ABC-2 type transport system permease protein|nr:ABC transporter permease [Propionibacteriaceae bacterium]
MTSGTAATRNHLTFTRIAASEWIKVATLKSTWFLLGCYLAFILFAGVGAAVLTVVGAEGQTIPGEEAADSVIELLSMMVTSLTPLVFMAFAALAVTNEYRSGQIRVTFTAAPRRTQVVLGKAAVAAVVTMVTVAVGYALGSVAALGVYAVLGTGFALSGPTSVSILGGILFAGAIAVMSAGLGWLTRSTAGAVMAGVLAFMLFPALAQQLMGLPGVGEVFYYVFLYWPTTLGSWLTSTQEALPPGGGVGMALMWVWAAAVTAGAIAVVCRRDA